MRKLVLVGETAARLLFILFPRPSQGMPNIRIQDRGFDGNGLVREVDVVSPSLYEFYPALGFSYRLEDISKFEGTDCGVVEERSEDEVGARGDNNDSVFPLI